ncbi:MAG: hypothetical protein ACUVT1_09925 [Anaerolineae bacterium]
MKLHGVFIQDTFAEAWDLEVARIILTAVEEDVAWAAAHQFAGAAGSSELGSRINAGIEHALPPQETPDGRPGVVVALTMPPNRHDQFVEELATRLVLATLIPTVAVFDGMLSDVTSTATLDLYALTAHHWAGYEEEREVAGRRVCEVPTTTGPFIYEKRITLSLEGTDGHIVCFAESQPAAVTAVKAAKAAVTRVGGVSPMGYGLEQVFRERDYIPALKHRVPGSKVPAGVKSALNLLMFGVNPARMRDAIREAIRAACHVDGVLEIGAMNFGGQFGRHQYWLCELLQ